MVDWEPISLDALLARISQGYARMTQAQQRLWDAIRINPEKWQQHSYGDAGGGFWTVGLIGRTVIWYNDLEDGFNRSVYSTFGVIDDYWCNDDELDVTVQYLANALSGGQGLSQIGSQFKKRA
ncbi:MAG TPA: hypothetical protein VGQ96_05690 [Candidatus Eremiobacteraceae bacterium]|nr:hypothetical protein [Candidatus Eremiobacteraceae bacterium]